MTPTTDHRTRPLSTYLVPEAVRQQLIELAGELARNDIETHAERYAFEAQLLSPGLPVDLRRRLLAFRRWGDPSGGLLLRGVPTGQLPPTPPHADDLSGSRLLAAAVMSLLLGGLGEQFGVAGELGGCMVQSVQPVRGFENTQQSLSSLDSLKLHVETAFTDHRPDFVALFCLRQDHDRVAGTWLSSIDALVTCLPIDVLDVLRQDRFITTVDGSFLRAAGIEGPIHVGPITVLSGPAARPRLRADFAETTGLDDEAQAALDHLLVTAHDVAVEIQLEAGDLLIIDNHHAFHGRTPFTPRWDGQDRWLLRSFATRDLSRSETSRPGDGRIIASDAVDAVIRHP